MQDLSLLQLRRASYLPPYPSLLQKIKDVQASDSGSSPSAVADPLLREQFPSTCDLPLLKFRQKPDGQVSAPLKVAILFSGGQAPGGENVICGLFDALKILDPSSQLLGFLDGPLGLIEQRFIELTENFLAPFRNQGGFDIIGSGRVKIETPEQFEAAAAALKKLSLDGLVIVGGDDSNTNAAHLAEYCKQKNVQTSIIGVPKTIDGDLKNSFIETSFGFDTASKVYSEIIGNLAKDALSSKKYYFFVKMMGRSASHLTLECALQTHVNLALIGEEIAHNNLKLADVVSQIADLICERGEAQKNFGVILIPEGLLEFIPECRVMIDELNRFLSIGQKIEGLLAKGSPSIKLETLRQNLNAQAFDCYSRLPQEIQKQLLLDRDPHGNIQLSKIETERLLISLVEQELSDRSLKGGKKWKFNPQPLFCGYEGRCALPTNFDCSYCYALGRLAALLILQGASGYMCCLKNLTQDKEQWEALGVPIVQMLHIEMRKNKSQAVIKKNLVDLNGPVFAAFKKERERWRVSDCYRSPGPIQFEGANELSWQLPLTLLLEQDVLLNSSLTQVK